MGHRKKHKTSLGSVVKDIGHSVKGIEKPIFHTVNKVIDTEGKIASQALHTVGGLGNSLMLPLLIIGGVAVIYVMNKQ